MSWSPPLSGWGWGTGGGPGELLGGGPGEPGEPAALERSDSCCNKDTKYKLEIENW